nr:murein biosynthesis integral membrane protein MurJ [uncultured Romboutsia sp.]
MSKVAKTAVSLMFVTLLAKVLGFVRELVLASSYGASSYSDAYLAALNIPNVIFSIIGVGLSTTFIPVYYDVIREKGEACSEKFINNVFNIVAVMCIILAISGYIFSDYLVKVFAIGFKGDTFNLAVDFTQIFIVGIISIGFSNVITAYLQIKGNFVIPGIITIPCNLIIVVSMILSLRYGVYVMAYGTLIGTISQFIIQIPFACKEGLRIRLYINLKDEYIKKMIYLICPVIIGVAVNQINIMVDKTIASTLVEGSISALNYSNRLNLFVTGLFISSISVVIYPMLSKLSSEDNKEKFRRSVVQSINSVILLVVPISIGAIVLATPIVKLLFQRGEFDARATSMTAIALIMYSIGMVAFGLRDILGKVFYALQDTKTPMINGAMAMIMNIVLNIILVKYLQLAGLALATSISAIVCIFLLFGSLKKKIGYFGQDKIIKTMIKSILSAVVMGIVTYFIYNMISNLLGVGFIKEVISLVVSVGIGAVTYAILVVLLKVEEINIITSMMKKKLNKVA